MQTAVKYDALRRLFVLKYYNSVLVVEVNSKVISGQLNSEQLASLHRNFLPRNFLEQVKVFSV